MVLSHMQNLLNQKVLIFFGLIILLSSGVWATINFNKDSVVLVGTLDEEICDTFVVYSSDFSGNINVEDRWADSSGDLSVYDLDSRDVGISVIYLNTIVDFNESITMDVCVIGEPGIYRGVLVFDSGVDDSELELVVEIESEKPVVTEIITENSKNTGRSSRGGITSKIVQNENENEIEYSELSITNNKTALDTEDSEADITGEVVDNNNTKIGTLQIIPIVFIFLIIGMKIYSGRKIRKLTEENVK